MTAAPHIPVMLAEVLEILAPCEGCLYVDATFGVGGYAAAVLDAAPCRVLAVDRDAEACRRAEGLIGRYGGRLMLAHGRFGDLCHLAAEQGVGAVDGIAFDLGVSSMQLDEAERGFSFRFDGPLDMRMDPSRGISAADAVNRLRPDELAGVIREFGEERFARRIAAAIGSSSSPTRITQPHIVER